MKLMKFRVLFAVDGVRLYIDVHVHVKLGAVCAYDFFSSTNKAGTNMKNV